MSLALEEVLEWQVELGAQARKGRDAELRKEGSLGKGKAYLASLQEKCYSGHAAVQAAGAKLDEPVRLSWGVQSLSCK